MTDADLSQGTGLDVTITRALNALALHLAGATDTQICKQLGFQNAMQARSSWERVLADTVTAEDKEKARRTEVARLDRLQTAWWTKAIDPAHAEQAVASRMVLSISEARRRLLGLDAPTRMEIYTPTAVEIVAYVDMLRSQAGVHDEVEPDILELDSTDVTDDPAA